MPRRKTGFVNGAFGRPDEGRVPTGANERGANADCALCLFPAKEKGGGGRGTMTRGA
jgi:hypothetical protein